jgi:AbrB family looped-hinge helix DNA binding protein
VESVITAKGQTTIPKAIREHLHLRPGQRVKYFIHPNGTVVLLPTLPVTALRGILKWHGPPATLEDMDQAIAEGAASGLVKPRKRR